MTAAAAARLGAPEAGGPDRVPGATPGVRVVLDARPLQEPDRAPLTAQYLDALLRAFDADPLEGESFALLLASDADDPTDGLTGLDVVGRRLLPPTRLLRSGALTIDPFLLSGASLGAAWRAERGGAAGRRLPRRRRIDPARDRAAARRDAPRPRAVGAAGRLPAVRGRAVRPAAPRSPAAATRRR